MTPVWKEVSPASRCDLPQHAPLRDLLRELASSELPGGASVGAAAIGRVLYRVALAAPHPVPQADIAKGAMLARPRSYSVGTVARAVEALTSVELLRREDTTTDMRGRTVVPYRLSSDYWHVVGLHVSYRDGWVRDVTGVLYSLDMTVIDVATQTFAPHSIDLEALAGEAASVVERLCGPLRSHRARLLGVGLAVSEIVHLDAVRGRGGYVPVGATMSALLSERLFELAPSGVTVIVENDANAHAIQRSYRFGHPTFALVAVTEDGVGAALVNQNRLVRGASGGSGEIGHVAVEYDHDENVFGFDSACSCGQRGHVDALATPDRIRQALGNKPLADAAGTPQFISADTITAEAAAFRRAGTALGRALATLFTLTNPGRFHLLLPPEIGEASPGSAGSAYLSAVEAQVNLAYGPAPADARESGVRLAVETIPIADAPRVGCRSAAWSVLHALIEHARQRQDCSPITLDRPLHQYDNTSVRPLA